MTNINWDETGIDGEQLSETTSADYKSPSEFPPPPPMGKYTFQGVGEPDTALTKNNNTLYLRGQVKVVGGEYDGRTAFIFVPNWGKPWRKDSGTMLEDFVRGTGALPANGQAFTLKELEETAKFVWAQVHKGYFSYEGYCKNCGKTVARGAKDAKKEYDGFTAVGFVDGATSVACPICGDTVEAKLSLLEIYPS